MKNTVKTKVCVSCNKKFSAYKDEYVKCPKCSKKENSSDKGVTVMNDRRNFKKEHIPQQNRAPNQKFKPLSNENKINQFYDDKGFLKKEIYDSLSRRIAKEFSDANLTASGMRRYYERVLAAYEEFKRGGENAYDKALETLRSLKPKVHYSEKRDVTPHCFTDFINHYIEKVEESEKNIKGFKELFMSVVGYSKKG